MHKPALIQAYLALSLIASPLWSLALRLRARAGKEDPARLSEKWGRASAPRPDGPLIWMHGVSVGESAALLTLIDRLRGARPDATVLLTTITLASAQALAKRKLPDGVIHQFLPVDTPAAVRRFVTHWRPDLAVVAEADWWPRLLIAVKKTGCPMVLLNTHVTPRRYRRRKRNPQANGWLMDMFDLIHVQDQRSFDLYRDLGRADGQDDGHGRAESGVQRLAGPAGCTRRVGRADRPPPALAGRVHQGAGGTAAF
jgi:3-deoxy-D-manno-octulosonic-acid transferase